jgi:hypothetical protein
VSKRTGWWEGTLILFHVFVVSPSYPRNIQRGVAAPVELDWAAVFRRVQDAINTLRTCHICEGWKLDEEGAARTLEYFRGQAAGLPDDMDEWKAAVKFIGDHGQSLDWILWGEANSMVAMLASHSRQARRSTSATHDPIFAAIEENRRLNEEWDRLERALDKAQGLARAEFGCRPSDDERAAWEWDERAGLEELQDRREEVVDAEEQHRMRLAQTKPSTVAGAAALVAYVVEDMEIGGHEWQTLALETVVEALNSMASVRA